MKHVTSITLAVLALSGCRAYSQCEMDVDRHMAFLYEECERIGRTDGNCAPVQIESDGEEQKRGCVRSAIVMSGGGAFLPDPVEPPQGPDPSDLGYQGQAGAPGN